MKKKILLCCSLFAVAATALCLSGNSFMKNVLVKGTEPVYTTIICEGNAPTQESMSFKTALGTEITCGFSEGFDPVTQLNATNDKKDQTLGCAFTLGYNQVFFTTGLFFGKIQSVVANVEVDTGSISSWYMAISPNEFTPTNPNPDPYPYQDVMHNAATLSLEAGEGVEMGGYLSIKYYGSNKLRIKSIEIKYGCGGEIGKKFL